MKRALSLIMVLAMILTMIPAVFADETSYVATATADDSGVIYNFESGGDAFNFITSEAGKGFCLQLLDDVVYENTVTHNNSGKIDLNGHCLTVSGFVAFSGSSIVDGSETKTGRLLTDRLSIPSDNAQMPIYVGSISGKDAYMLATPDMSRQMYNEWTTDTVHYQSLPRLGKTVIGNKSELVDAYFSEDGRDLQTLIRISFTTKDGKADHRDFLFPADMAVNAYTSTSFGLKATGLSNVSNVAISTVVRSVKTGYESVSAPITAPLNSENGYYVVWDDVTWTAISNVDMISSWDVTIPTGVVTKASDGFCFMDSSEYARAQALREFNAISDDFTWEFSMRAPGSMTDTYLDLKSGDTTAIRFAVDADKLYLNNEELSAVPTDTLANYKLHISPAKGTFTISVDGKTVMNGDAAKEFTFLNYCSAVDRIYIETGEEAIGQVILGTVRIYVDYYVNEKFLDGTNGVINDNWTVTGDATTVFESGTQGPDKHSAILKDGASITREATYEQNGAWVEYQHLMKENVGEFAMVLSDDAGNEFKVATKDGTFGYYDGNDFVELYDCMENLWYHVMLKQTDMGTEIYLNHKQKNQKAADGEYVLIDLPFEKFTRITFTADGGEAMLDDIVVKDWIPLPDDYVPEPVVVEKEEGSALVGLQSCNLWVEGEHFGYDWLTNWEERTPLLGYYDEILPEVADWELKFKVEHGIDFELFCWYRPRSGNDAPIKMARNARALHEGYMNAEYSDMMKFAITWESGSPVSGLEDFKENVVRYWIEQYFKDERYLVIDNKPVVGLYNISNLKGYFGGTIEGVKEAVDALRAACVEAGFDGAYVIMCNKSESEAADIAQAGFDGQYAYSWGITSADIDVQIKGLEGIQNALVAEGEAANGVVPVVSMGRDDAAWNLNAGGYCTIEDFQELLEWVKNDFMPTLDSTSIGSKMMLLDNWNEYGEGHFLMPAKLEGFGYLDAVRGVFGDGDGVDGEHTVNDIVPTEAQRARINHMYVQDRHVVLFDNQEAGNLEAMEDYTWTFDVDGNAEGWSVDVNAGKWIKDLAEWAITDGKFYGKTYTPEQLAEKVANGTYPEGATADPSILSPDNLNLNANEAIAVKFRMKVKIDDAVSAPQLFFTTTDATTFSSSRVLTGVYKESEDGYAEVTFNMTASALWTGTIKQLRLDPMYYDGEFWIDSVEVLRRKSGGDAEIYLNGARVYTNNPVATKNGSYMFPAEELGAIMHCFVTETLEKDSLFIYTDTAFFELPYTGDVKLFVNGKAVDSVGAAVINGITYVPIVDVMENIGTVKDVIGETHPAYEVETIPATAQTKAKVNIEKYVDPAVLRGYNFSSSTESWTYGGKNTVKTPAVNSVGALEVTADGSDTRIWSPESQLFDVNAQKADHIRMRVAASASKKISVVVYGDGTTYKHTYYIALTEAMLEEDGFYTVMLDLAEAKEGGLATAKQIDKVCIYWYDEAAGGTQTFAIDTFQVLDIVEDEAGKVAVEESPYTIYDWDFTQSTSGWIKGGKTGVAHDPDKKALTVTCNQNGSKYNMNVWSSDVETETSAIKNPIGISAAEATHVLVRVQSAEELTNMRLQLQFVNEDGTCVDAALSYDNIPYAKDINGDYFAMIDLTSIEGWDTDMTIGRICVYPMGSNITANDVGKEVKITSVEILDKNWYVEYESHYFTSSTDSWGIGGTTGMDLVANALKVSPPTKAGDYKPRVWSSDKVLYGYSAGDVTHVRIRVKAVVPDAMMEEQKAELADTEDLLMYLVLSDATQLTTTLPYEIGTEDYVTLTYDISDLIPEGKKLDRVGLYPFGSDGNQLLCEAGASVMIDSVQFLRKTSEDDESPALKVLIIGNSITSHTPSMDELHWAGNWGMAATSADKDYVHLLEDYIKAKNGAVEVMIAPVAEYERNFYDWSLIKNPQDQAASWNADIIIATFGANINNGSNENDSSFESDYIFTAEKYKKIIDKFNPDGDAKVIAGATVLTDEVIVKVIKEAAEEYGYTYRDMTEWTADEYKARPYEAELLALYYAAGGDTSVTSIISSVLNHPGDLGMKMIADELWEELENQGWIPQGIPAVEEEEPETPVDPEVPEVDPEIPEDTDNAAFKWTFDSGKENWAAGGTGNSTAAHNDAEGTYLTLSFGGQKKAALWSTEVKDGYTYPSIDLTTLDKIELRVKHLIADEQTLQITLYDFTGSTAVAICSAYVTEEIGTDWTVITINASDIAWTVETGTIQRIYLVPSNPSSDAGELFAIDYLKLYTKEAASATADA